MKYYDLITRKNVVTAATGAGAIYLLAKTILAMFRSPSFKPEPRDLHRYSVEFRPIPCARATIPGELKRTLQSLKPTLDDSSKKVALHTITQCIFLKESEASTCTYDDIKLVASFLDDPDEAVKTEALNALKAFTTIWKFKIKIQEYVSKIIELVVNKRNSNLQTAGLRLVNGLHVTEQTHPMLRGLLSKFLDILQLSDTLAKVQVLKLLSTMAQKEDLLFDILNCQVSTDFLSLLQPSLPGNLLYEMLVFVERLSEGQLTPQYQSMHQQYNSHSLHNIFFGENSRLSDHLLALIIHPEEEVQIQACKVILSLRLNKEEGRVISSLPFSNQSIDSTISTHPIDPTPCSLPFSPGIASSPATNNVIVDTSISDDADHDFQPLQGTNDNSYNFVPLESTGHNHFPVRDSSNISSHPTDQTTSSAPVFLDPMNDFQPIAASSSGEDSDRC